MIYYPIFAAGLVFLMLGGDWLVKGAVGVAEKFGIPSLVIGLTIVAFGTSAPELVISLDAALAGAPGIAIGNVVGSNIANVLLVLGVPALIATITGVQEGMKPTLTFLIVTAIIFTYYLLQGEIDRMAGLVLLLCLALFLAQQFFFAKNNQEQDGDDDYHDEIGEVPSKWGPIIFFLLLGMVTLPLAAHATVLSASAIAKSWHVSDAVIGLTIVAFGTSLPELATGISAARSGNASLGLGNVIGSNLFNMAAIIGITAAVVPIPVDPHIIQFDVWIMGLSTLLLLALPVLKLQINRAGGIVLLSCYMAYMVFTVVT